MASAEREPITGVWGGAPIGVQGQSPCQGVRVSFWTFNGSGKFDYFSEI